MTRYIHKLIEYPEALQVLEFARGRVSLIAVRAISGGPMVGHIISELPQLVPGIDMRFVAIYRTDERGADQQVVCDGATRIEPGDEVFVLAATKDIRRVLDTLRRRDEPVRRVIIAGGGRVGLRLARELRRRLPRQGHREQRAALRVPGDAAAGSTRSCCNADSTDEELLENENVRDTDLFLALTSDDEDNIMACLLAKRMGAKRVLALINRRAYADLVQGTQIDIALSPAQTVIGELLAHVRRGDVEAVYSLRRGAAEALADGGARRPQVVEGGRPAHRGAGAAAGRADRRAGARRGRRCAGHHSAPRHGDRERRPRHRLPAAQAHGARGREAVPGRRDVLLTVAPPARRPRRCVGRHRRCCSRC